MPAEAADNGALVFAAALERMGLAQHGVRAAMQHLSGGVSSDIVRVESGGGPICLKRALPKLKVKADWQAPIERSRFEVQWMRVAGAIEPTAVPRILGEDAQSGIFAMAFLDPARYPVWKAQLLQGNAQPRFAAVVGARLGSIHAHTAGNSQIARVFATDHIFFPIRLEPYLAATARAHPDLTAPLTQLIEITGRTKLVLVHGDVSPKNILAGPEGPVFLDAECAWYGDPAFDLAFCLNHLLLKCVWRPQSASGYLACFSALSDSYLEQVSWEARANLETRAAALLPGLLLARIDGKSPVEYITQEDKRMLVRHFAQPLLLEPVGELRAIRAAWESAVSTLAPKHSDHAT